MKTKILASMGIAAFLIWSGMALFDPSLRSAYLTFIISVVTGVSALALHNKPTQSDKPKDTQP